MDTRLGAIVVVVALSAILMSLVAIPDFIRYHKRIDRMEQRLRAHCSEWTVLTDPDYLPFHELLVKKCVPKHPEAGSKPSVQQ
jgi:hypothetical protein